MSRSSQVHRIKMAGVLLILILTTLALPAVDTAHAATVAIPDPALEATIRSAIAKPSGELTDEDMRSLVTLTAYAANVHDLTGLEYATNLTSLTVGYSFMTDLAPLTGLTKLTRLDLRFTQVADLTPLAGLKNLTVLSVRFSQVTDVTPLAGLTNLTVLGLRGNQINDVTPLAGLTELRYLELGENEVSDVTPLFGLMNLQSLVLDDNCLDLTPDSPASTMIASLGSRGVGFGSLSQKTHAVVPISGAHGFVSPGVTADLYHGADVTFTVCPEEGYHVEEVLVDDVSIGAPRSYTLHDVLGDHTISARFAIDTFTITPSASPHGSISPDTPQTVDYGGLRQFTITPEPGYHIADILRDGVSVGASSSVTCSDVRADQTLLAVFAVNTYELSYSARDGGSIEGSSTQSIQHGSAGTTVTAQPDAGHHFVRWSDGDTSRERRDRGVGADTRVEALFVADPVTLLTSTRLSGPTSSKLKKALKLSGAVSPGGPGSITITQQRKVGGKWKSAGHGHATVVGGEYRYSFKPRYKGPWRFCANYSGGADGITTYASSKTRYKNVTVK